MDAVQDIVINEIPDLKTALGLTETSIFSADRTKSDLPAGLTSSAMAG
jgi:hypothetical protein